MDDMITADGQDRDIAPRQTPPHHFDSATPARRVVSLDAGYSAYDVEMERLATEGASFEIFHGGRHDRPGKLAFARGAAGVMARWTVLDCDAFDALPHLQYVVRYGVGYDNIDLDAASERGILVANVQGYATHSVSDHALALIFACIRALPPGMAGLRTRYNAPPVVNIPELHTLTLGIVGLGRIGGALARKAGNLFARVMACDPYVSGDRYAECGAEPTDLETLLALADVVSLHCNLTSETHHLIDTRALGRMRPGSYLVNTARGQVVDEEALLPALESGRLAGIGLDVYGEEPPPPGLDALLAHPAVAATGHYAWFSTEAALELQRRAAENMAIFLSGGIPEDCLNPQAREGRR